ncbi:MAG: hypothetical protein MK101_09795 [Phycisphaerales bacterium]|nr:hypothetical protein [Phycisphaerales bacterium]
MLSLTASLLMPGLLGLAAESDDAVDEGPADSLTSQELEDADIGAPPGAPLLGEQPLGDPFPAGIELDWLGPAADNLRFSIDLAGRAQYASASRAWSTVQFYGFDLYKVFSGDTGDIATMVLQGFATRIDNVEPPPYFFDSATDWEFIWRQFFINWRVDPRGRFNVKMGHWEMPFGLEQVLATNGTLRQVGTMRNLGEKLDWGVTANGVGGGVEYEVGLGRGSGNEWRNEGDPWSICGRVGTISEVDHWVGLSGMAGDLWRPGGVQVQRRRLGIDAGVHHEAWTLMGELSGGSNDGDATINGLLDLSWRSPSETWLCWGQLQSWNTRSEGWSRDVKGVLGVQWALDKHIVLSAQFIQDLSISAPGSRSSTVQFQVRYRF